MEGYKDTRRCLLCEVGMYSSVRLYQGHPSDVSDTALEILKNLFPHTRAEKLFRRHHLRLLLQYPPVCIFLHMWSRGNTDEKPWPPHFGQSPSKRANTSVFSGRLSSTTFLSLSLSVFLAISTSVHHYISLSLIYVCNMWVCECSHVCGCILFSLCV